MGETKFEFRRERKRRRVENPPESENDSESSGDDAGSSDGAYDELYDTDNGDDDDDNNDNIKEELEEEESKALARKRKLEEVYGAERNKSNEKKSKDRLKVPTTAEEVKRLRETEKLFHSNLYRLQIEEMLKEVKVKRKYVQKFDEWFPSLESSLLSMEDQEEKDLTDLEWVQELGVALPLHQHQEFKGRFIFKPPTSVSVIGSHVDGCSIGPKLNIDVAVDMPEEIFFKKDFRNERFHRKRSLYLCCIAAHLVSSDLIENDTDHGPRFVLSYCGDPLLPVLEVSPAGCLAHKAKVRIHAFAPSTIFKLSLLSPSKNNVDVEMLSEGTEQGNKEPTPFHNASTLAVLVARTNDELKKSTIASHQNILDALILLKVWMRQRGFDQGYAGFGSHLLTMLVVYLVQKRRLSPQMSSYQIIRIVWNFLGETDWTTAEGAPTLGDAKAAEFLQKYQVAFLDVTGVYNFAYSLTATTYARVRSESRRALHFLDNTTIDSFQALFISQIPFCRQFDHVLRFTNAVCLETMIEEKATVGQKLDGIVNKERLAVSLILEQLKRGLASRVKEWGIQCSPPASWPISESPPSLLSSEFLIGVNLDPQHAFSILDKGPGANEPEAADFRAFWGKKSELRRFQDGSISEAVVWLDGKASLAERRVVCKLIVKYLLEHRLGVADEHVVYLADQIEETLHVTHVRHSDFTYGTGEEATLAVLAAFGKLSKNIRDLADLPLEVTEIQGVSPTFRYAEVFPPLSTVFTSQKNTFEIESCLGLDTKTNVERFFVPRCTPAMEVVVSLGLSGKWPSKAEAVRRIRAAFNIKIAKRLQESFRLTAKAHPDYVDVIQNGFVFRLRVAYQNEIGLLKEIHLPDGSLKHQENPDSMALECKIIHLPSISGHLHGLHQQAPAFGPTACLAKRWISSQMILGEHIPEIVVELLVAYTFLRPEPFSTATQPQTAFLRFLHFIGKTNWNTQTVMLNFKGEISSEEEAEIEKYFTAQRKSLPPLFIVTPTDHKKSVWTMTAPSLTILIRLAQLAQAALSVLEELYTAKTPNLEAWKQIYTPDLSVYDILIRLKFSALPRKFEALCLTSKRDRKAWELRPYQYDTSERIPVVGFDPVQMYLRDLRASFGDFALFFHDTYGGNVIGVVWKPSALGARNFSVNQINGRHLVDGHLELNQNAIIEDFCIMGKGLVHSVDAPEHSECAVSDGGK